MTLYELSLEYRESAALLRQRIRALETQLTEKTMCEMERLRLRGRIETLRSMLHDTARTANVLEHYYDKGYRRDGRYTL